MPQLLRAAIAALLACLVVAGCGTATGSPDPSVAVTPTTAATLAPTADPEPDPTPPSPTATPTEAVDPLSGLPWVDPADLPPEASDTLALIDAGGPFPFDRDGLTFQNREGLLPERPRGTYREYTVVTPGEDDRGARRIVTGPPGEAYYTADHYASFVRIRLP